MVALYDAISTLCAGVGEALNEDRHAEVLLPPLIERWNAFADDDRRLLPIFECLQDIGKAMGMGFQSLAPNIFERCVRIIENVVIMKAAAEHAEEVVDPGEDEGHERNGEERRRGKEPTMYLIPTLSYTYTSPCTLTPSPPPHFFPPLPPSP